MSTRTDLIYTTRTTCRSCADPVLEDVLSLGDQYLAGFVNQVDKNWPKAPLDLVRCNACGLLQLRHQVDPEQLCRDYWYRSGINQTMRDALGDIVLDGNKYAREGVWLDIGANDGTLLSRVGERFTKIGCEPALNMIPLLEEHADKMIDDFFEARRFLDLTEEADVITSCAMFYHLNDPDRFVSDIARCLGPDGVWINQLSDAPTMLRKNTFDGICHEHACYYDVPTLADIYKRHGLNIVSVKFNDVNGGSVRIAAMKRKFTGALAGVPETTTKDIEAFANRVRRWKQMMSDILHMPGTEETWVIGASTKGAVQLQYLDQNDRLFAIADRNPAKWGKFATGSWLPVTDEVTLRKAKPKYAVNMLYGFKDEIMLREAELRASGTTIINSLPHPEFIL